MKKEIGYIGLGKMGKNMVLRLLESGWNVVGYNRSRESVNEIVEKGAIGASDLNDLVAKLPTPRTIWLMVPHQAVEAVLDELTPLLSAGDTVIEGGNSPYRDSIRRGKALSEKGIEFIDIGVSGGPGGARNGACMMIGGSKEIYDRLEIAGLFNDTCLPQGWGYIGTVGAGHYVKMVHNGIEYGMMQSIAEGFDLMRHAKEFDLDLNEVTNVYSHGSVITSSLVSWMHDAYEKYGKDLNEISGKASASGEGKWTLEAGVRDGIDMPSIALALQKREASQQQPTYQGKVVSAMRGEFGHHPVMRSAGEPVVF